MSHLGSTVSASTSSVSPAKTPQCGVVSQSGRLNDLWSQAASKFEQQIDFGKVNKTDILTDVWNLARKTQESAAQKKWKITRRNGKVIYFRDIYGHIASCVQKFREVGDVAVQYDPGHAALPWAGVGFFIGGLMYRC